ncbi:uncharacterized protein ec isoform X1 [Tribolium castaneum]|uniref:USP domain-containing protein n=1 Tax=Tribolium castaneum TaxID=7070 RepID=D6X4D4_TRICA|nr:PREDICTED: uncharacterized protein LOC658848 isoform X1 [Tribolium castaneum]EEZ97283.2 hypothetical protein TcasGA2_TC011087 [Tribolium castaneum]|eukprot:XP_970294.2 PREDICTED: uncharacterized protein LOC658848 isoform X1 [Tribolium castaneum]
MATPIVSLHPMPISIATPSRDSMTFTSTKGLLNGPGQNNCFLNSAVQVLWHLDIFRRSFRDLSGHACMADSCIFCALKELFSQLQFSNETALPPDALRRALAESFFDQQRFQLGFMDDAAECFENMLLRIHMHIAHGEAEDMCNARHCIPHQKFAMTLVEQSVCNSCGATSEPLSYTQMVHYVSTSTLVYQVRTTRPQGIIEPFGQLLRKAGSMGDIRVCPSACGAVIQIGRTLMNRPEIVSVGLVWNSERPTLEHIMEVFSTIGTTLRLGEVFNSVIDSRWAETSVHTLVGVVTYYGKHYSTFFFHTKLRVWIYFDDATVREVGPRWDQVVDKCRKGRYQPLLLLYALPDGTPVNTENAPKQVVPFYDKPKKLGLRRSVTPSPEKPIIGTTRRAITPNPDGTTCQKPPLPRSYNEYQNLSVIQSNLYPEPHRNIHRTLSNGSSSGTEGLFRDYPNVPRTRDSGNWSSDRNSASSSSSTTMENPYLYLVGKVPEPTQRNESSSSTSSGVYDVGYDSYSLSSNDSSTMTTIQHMMKMGHLAKIPEDYNPGGQAQVSQSCDVLCDEADELLVKSRQLEDDHDLVLALALCNAAATKARAAMDAPYNNPQTLTLARMKHNTCIMRARSLHRRMTQNQAQNKDVPPEIRHTREGSSGSCGKHSRQSSHSRQNSKEIVEKPAKNIEIYATLPKKKKVVSIEDQEEVLYDKPPGRESRSIFSRKNKEKRSRSEDRNKVTKELSIAPEPPKKEVKTKKQHKIRRKLLMGGLIRRKNRSMPDLTDTCEKEKPTTTVDDSRVGLNGGSTTDMCGYLSEGHLEFTNPNLERSKLMRKSFHGSAGKILTAAKVPPPPPLRTTSQLTTNKEYYPLYHNLVVTRADVHQEGVDEVDCAPPSNLDLPPYPSPLGSVIHSRQASEEFPPPPPPLDLSALDEHLKPPTPPPTPPSTLLAELQVKRQEILAPGDTWLKELQAKQAALRKKQESVGSPGTSVRDLASKFENIQVFEGQNGVVTARKRDDFDIPPEIPDEKRGKKKSVSFCDQVILVATAEEQEDDSYIPNPILERVLRSAMNKPETAAIRQEVRTLRQEMSPEPFVRRNSMDNLLSRQAPPPDPLYYNNYAQSPYQRIPQNSPVYNAPPSYPQYQYVRPPVYQHPPSPRPVYQERVPPLHPEYTPYQPIPRQLLRKSVSFEPGTKGGAESPTPKAVVTPIVVNNANNSVPTGKTKCNLCRKKAVVSANLYCTDCEFYMSRFKPKR